MLPILTASLSLLTACVVAQPYDALISTLMARQTVNLPSRDCNATCSAFMAAQKACNFLFCSCTHTYLQAQGDCFLCQTDTQQDAASVQFFLDEETNKCHHDGISIKLKLKLPPDAQTIVNHIDRQSAILRQQQAVFLALQISGGHIGLVIVLCLALFSRKVHRDPTFLNFCITWIFSSIVYSSLLYHGTKGNTVLAPLGRVASNACVAQAALTNGAQVMAACSTMALVIQLWIGLHAAIHGDLTGPTHKNWTTIVLLVMPYVFFFTFAIPSIFVGKTHVVIDGTLSQRVLPTRFYCTVVEQNSLLRALYGAMFGLLIVTVVFDFLIINIMYRHWRAFRRVSTAGPISLSILLRVIMFSIYRIAVAVACGIILDRPPLPFVVGNADSRNILSVSFGIPIWADMLQAAIPLVGFLIFGLNTDIITSCMFWRKNQPDSALPIQANTTFQFTRVLTSATTVPGTKWYRYRARNLSVQV